MLQWHHMASSAGVPTGTVPGPRENTLYDGLFPLSAYAFVLAGVALLWRRAGRAHEKASSRKLLGGILVGFSLFNPVEGLIDHHLLGLHRVNETVPREEWIAWDLGFLLVGALLLAIGWKLLRPRRAASTSAAPDARRG